MKMILRLLLVISIFSICAFGTEKLSDFVKYTSACKTIVEKNGTSVEEKGWYRLSYQCTSWGFNAEDSTPICNKDEVCKNLLCCPINLFQSTYDPVEHYIYPILLSSGSCKIPGTDIEGIYKRKSECLEQIPKHRVCQFDFCENFVCCPSVKNEEIPVYEAVEVKCLFETEEERLTETVGDPSDNRFCEYTCRPYFQCLPYKNHYH